MHHVEDIKKITKSRKTSLTIETVSVTFTIKETVINQCGPPINMTNEPIHAKQIQYTRDHPGYIVISPETKPESDQLPRFFRELDEVCTELQERIGYTRDEMNEKGANFVYSVVPYTAVFQQPVVIYDKLEFATSILPESQKIGLDQLIAIAASKQLQVTITDEPPRL